MKRFFTFQNLPLTIIVILIAISVASLISVLFA